MLQFCHLKLRANGELSVHMDIVPTLHWRALPQTTMMHVATKHRLDNFTSCLDCKQDNVLLSCVVHSCIGALISMGHHYVSSTIHSSVQFLQLFQPITSKVSVSAHEMWVCFCSSFLCHTIITCYVWQNWSLHLEQNVCTACEILLLLQLGCS